MSSTAKQAQHVSITLRILAWVALILGLAATAWVAVESLSRDCPDFGIDGYDNCIEGSPLVAVVAGGTTALSAIATWAVLSLGSVVAGHIATQNRPIPDSPAE